MAILKPEINLPLTVRFRFNTPKERPEHPQYGKSWGYGVNDEDILFADQKLHDALQQAGVHQGTEATILKTQTQEDGKSHNHFRVTSSTAAASSQDTHNDGWAPETREDPPPIGEAPSQHQAAPSQGDAFDDLVHTFKECVGAALHASPEHWTSEDQRALAISMAIECHRKNIRP